MATQAELTAQLLASIATGASDQPAFPAAGDKPNRFDKIKADTVGYVQSFVGGQQIHGLGGFSSINIGEADEGTLIGRLLTAARSNGTGKASYGNALCYITVFIKGSKKPEAPVTDESFKAGLFDPDAPDAPTGQGNDNVAVVADIPVMAADPVMPTVDAS